jgi:hypothetical protein
VNSIPNATIISFAGVGMLGMLKRKVAMMKLPMQTKDSNLLTTRIIPRIESKIWNRNVFMMCI